MKKVELLAPVGSKDAFFAAIYNHADAVYLGGKAFGARAHADNFSNQELQEMISIAHLHDVKVYVTVNTVVYDSEWADLIHFLDFLYLNDCDAVIVQDLGVAKLIAHRYPQMDLHASTQMNIHSVEQAKVLKNLGFKRIVLARETALKDVIAIKQGVDIEIEVFVHGALCVSCSGNCYMSSLIGKRSGNRGRCAQPCRLPYTYNGETKYFISPKDLNTLDFIPELIDSGIDSFKIEGRMRRPEYVATVLQSYQKAINAYYEKSTIDLKPEQHHLLTIFNREFTKGFLLNETNENLINEESSNHIGIEIGKVVACHNNYVDILLTQPLNFGDAIRIKGQVEDAMIINQIYVNKQIVKEAQAGNLITIKSHLPGLDQSIVYLTTDQKQIEAMQASYQNQKSLLPISGVVFLAENYLGLQLEYQEKMVKVLSDEPFLWSDNPQANDRLLAQISKTGNSPFYFTKLVFDSTRMVFLPVKQINELRRKALNELIKVSSVKHGKRMINEKPLPDITTSALTKGLIAKVRNEEQLLTVVNYDFQAIYVTDWELMKWQNQYSHHRFVYVIPRINHQLYNDGLYVTSELSNVRNNFTSIYLPVTNSYSLYHLFELGAKKVGLSLELSFSQIKQLIDEFTNKFNQHPNVEMMVYGRYELMMMKYCLQKNHGGCKLCASTDKQLVDRRGFSFPVFKDAQCYVKILNSKKLHLGDYLNMLYDNGVTNLLLDFTIESALETKAVCEVYCNNNHDYAISEVTFGHFKEGVL
ncbi:MAG: DUF3656 domain-containing protein [Bacilli bacterium]